MKSGSMTTVDKNPSMEAFEIEESSEDGSEKEENKTKEQGSHWLACGAILFNGTVGGGLLNMPASVINTGGFAVGFSIICAFAVYAFTSNMIVIWASDFKKANSYQLMVRSVLGKPGELMSAFFVMFLMFCGNCYVFIGMSDMAQRVVIDCVGSEYYCEHWFVQRTFVSGLIMTVVILPPCLVMHIDSLKYISAVAVVAIFSVIGVTIYEYYDSGIRYAVPTSLERLPITWTDVFLGIPGMLISFSNIYSTVNVYARQKPRNQLVYARAVVFANALTAACYCVTAYYACTLFGPIVADDFTKSFVSRNWVVRAAFIAYTIKLCFELPVLQFVGWASIETYIEACTGGRGFGSKKLERVRRVIVSLLWLSAVFVVCTILGTLSMVSGVMSIFVLFIMSFIPGIIALHGMVKFPGRLPRWLETFTRFVAIFLLVISAFLVGVVATQYESFLARAHVEFAQHSCNVN